MSRPSTAARVISIFFGFVFMALGLALSSAFLRVDPTHLESNRWAGVVFSAIFAAIGVGVICAVIYGYRKLKEQADAEAGNPGAPWLWRKDWAANRAESRNRNNAYGLWAAAIFVNGIVLTIAAGVAPQFRQALDPKLFFVLALCLAGVIPGGMAVRATIRQKRFGSTYFEFATLPFSPGRRLKGTIHLRLNTTASHGIGLSLCCVRKVITGNGKQRSSLETVLWQADQNVPQALLASDGTGNAIVPVEFSIPSDAYESNYDRPNDQVLWLLHAQADVPGIDYSDDFEVPIFRLTPSSVPATDPATAFRNDPRDEPALPAFQSDPTDVAAPPNPKVVISTTMDGSTEFCFPALRNPFQVLNLVCFTIVWTTVVYLLAHFKAPIVFTVVFGLAELLLIYGLIRSTLVDYRIQAGNDKIIRRRTLAGIGRARELLFSDIAQILAVTRPRQPGAAVSYSLRVLMKNGERVSLADMIADRQEARWIAAQLEKICGLQLDTHVAVDGGLFDYGPPPQRGQVPSRYAARTNYNSPAALTMVVVFFLVSTGVVASLFLARNYGTPMRVPRNLATAKTVPHPAFHSPLTNVDLKRIQMLPEQAQAEELLERAIQHDARALDLLEKNIDGWHGLQRNAQMNELERRSEFSTDLRIRYATADLNLAIDGVPKTDASVDALIAQAQTDRAHRACSVYDMGMLAGRHVGYGRLYPVLVDYARNDSDPRVRQWAVEGMRYLGTDQALDELFYSFTHDTSDAVRDRAGCNVSDCGNFKRKQRLRMVPKLIDLAADPKTSSKMRNWTFLALREITDVTLPADASLWRDWYAQHGAEKMAEFDRLEWWRVRGDQ